MFTRIVVGVDGSETAERAAVRAAEIAVSSGARLYVVSAFGKLQAETFRSGEERITFTNEADAFDVAQSSATALGHGLPSLMVEGMAADGAPAEALVKVADRLDAELIVVGNRRVQGLARVLGSVARSVAVHAHCDVYIAHTTGS